MLQCHLLIIGKTLLFNILRGIVMKTLKKEAMLTREKTLPGREQVMTVPKRHFITSNSLQEPFPAHLEQAVFGMGCFWGAERRFWELPEVYSTAVGYAGGFTPNPDYKEVCSEQTGHSEVVLVVFDPSLIGFSELLKTFWESHDPTQGMRQGNDKGTQYRSSIYTFDDRQLSFAETSKETYQQVLQNAGFDPVTTEIKPLDNFYYAEEYHQQYLAKNTQGYCGLAGTGISCV